MIHGVRTVIALCKVLLLAGAGFAVASIAQAKQLAWHPCHLEQQIGEARCGTYEVFENRIRNVGRKILLNLVVLPAVDRSHAAEAVFWLSGGPGDNATGTVGAAKGGFLEALRQKHDLVFVDQRGTGDSNGLFCDMGDAPTHLQAFFGQFFERSEIVACRKAAEKKADLRFYTTAIAMDDLDDVRAALGYEKINLAAASYGSLATQVYLRQHGDHARAAFLLGVATPAIKQPLLFAPASQRALDMLYTDCAADTLCKAEYPDFREEFDAVLKRFRNGPLKVQMIDPVSKNPVTVSLNRANYVEQLRLMLYSTSTSRYLPMIVHAAHRGDFIPFEEVTLGLSGRPLARGMYFTITCSEGVPFISEREIVEQSGGTFVGEERTRAHIAACKDWPRGYVPPGFISLVRSDVPVLMVSGLNDGSTPPRFGEEAMKPLPNGRQIEVPYYGHQLDSPCVWALMASFIDKGSARDLDTSCIAQIKRPPFATKVPQRFEINSTKLKQ